MLGSEEEELLESLIDKCDLFVIISVHKDRARIFDKLKEHSYEVTFVKLKRSQTNIGEIHIR